MCGCRYWGHGYLVYGPYQLHYIYQFHFTFLTVILIKWWLIWWYITIWKSYYQMLTHMVIYHKLIVKSPNDSSASPCHGPCDSMRSPFDSIPSPSDLFELPSDFEITKWDHHLRYHHLAPCHFMALAKYRQCKTDCFMWKFNPESWITSNFLIHPHFRPEMTSLKIVWFSKDSHKF